MLLGMEWYWWLAICAVVLLSIPLKMKFMRWWARRQLADKQGKKDKWGDEQ